MHCRLSLTLSGVLLQRRPSESLSTAQRRKRLAPRIFLQALPKCFFLTFTRLFHNL